MISESQDDSEAVGTEHVMEEITVNVDLPDADGAEELEPSSQEPRDEVNLNAQVERDAHQIGFRDKNNNVVLQGCPVLCAC